MITGPGDPELLSKIADAPSLNVVILFKEDFEEASIIALQLLAAEKKKPFIACVWYELEIPDDVFLPNVIIVRCGHESPREFEKRISKIVEEWNAGPVHDVGNV